VSRIAPGLKIASVFRIVQYLAGYMNTDLASVTAYHLDSMNTQVWAESFKCQSQLAPEFDE
jgi:hypothetical protein